MIIIYSVAIQLLFLLLAGLRIANQYERAVIFRLGNDPPSKWRTPLISSCGSRKVFDGYSASAIHG